MLQKCKSGKPLKTQNFRGILKGIRVFFLQYSENTYGIVLEPNIFCVWNSKNGLFCIRKIDQYPSNFTAAKFYGFTEIKCHDYNLIKG